MQVTSAWPCTPLLLTSGGISDIGELTERLWKSKKHSDFYLYLDKREFLSLTASVVRPVRYRKQAQGS